MLTNTKAITTEGTLFVGNQITIGNVTVRFTSDKHGESLSLSFKDGIMITVAYEGVEKLIKQTRKIKEETEK